MVNFYNDYVTCKETAKLSDVAGEQHQPEHPSLFPGFSSPSLLSSQITLNTSRGWLERKSSVLVEIMTASQGECGRLSRKEAS